MNVSIVMHKALNVTLVDHMGSDAHIVNAARVSFDKESSNYTKEQNEKLIFYLAKHNHWSPFAHTSLSLRVRAPLFVARQLGKHQVGLTWNEVSRRYVDSPPDFYTPEVWHKRAANAKQGCSDDIITWLNRDTAINTAVYRAQSMCNTLYKDLLEAGVAPEEARMVLPQSMYTEWIWTGSLLAFHRVFKQRTDPHAQTATQAIAYMIGDICLDLFPTSWKALQNA
jgi:thymidylate synthase (FAD)